MKVTIGSEYWSKQRGDKGGGRSSQDACGDVWAEELFTQPRAPHVNAVGQRISGTAQVVCLEITTADVVHKHEFSSGLGEQDLPSESEEDALGAGLEQRNRRR